MRKIPILTVTRTLITPVAACRFVDFGGSSASAGEQPLGVSDYAGIAGDDIAVTVHGTASVESGGVFVEGDPLTTGADGKAVKHTGTGPIVARALDDSAGPGQLTEVLLLPG